MRFERGSSEEEKGGAFFRWKAKNKKDFLQSMPFDGMMGGLTHKVKF